MMKRKLCVALAAFAAALIFSGCGESPEWTDEPLFRRVPVPVVIVEPEATAATEPEGFSFGDIAWQVCYCQAEEKPHVTRHAVVSQEGDWLTVTTCVADDPDVLRQVLPEYLADPGTSVELLLASECYKSEAEALAAADGEDDHG